MMKKLVIFDLDGTLLNTIADLAAATNQALHTLGFPTHEEKSYLQFVGNGIYKLFERALPLPYRTTEHIARVKELFVPYYNTHGTDLTSPYAGIPALLEALQQRGLRLAVASNKYQAATAQLVAHYFPTVCFAAVYGQQDGLPTKPNPVLVEKIMQQVSVSAAETLYVGDSEVDMQTALNAQVEACAVLWGFRTRAQLQAYHPAYLAEKPADILRCLE